MAIILKFARYYCHQSIQKIIQGQLELEYTILLGLLFII